MSFLRIAKMGHPILRQVAEPVDPAVIKTKEFQQLCDDLELTMWESDGIGLAAPQVYHSIQLLVAQLDADAPCPGPKP